MYLWLSYLILYGLKIMLRRLSIPTDPISEISSVKGTEQVWRQSAAEESRRYRE